MAGAVCYCCWKWNAVFGGRYHESSMNLSLTTRLRSRKKHVVFPSFNTQSPSLLRLSRATDSSHSNSHHLVPPPIDHDLHEMMATEGTEVCEDGSVETFGNDDLAVNAAGDGVVVMDLSHFGRIRVTGEDRIQFLHNQSTANFECLHEGLGCDTVFVTPTARTIDIAHAWVMKNAITLLVSPTTSKGIIDMLNKYIFFADQVEIQDITKQTCFFVLSGPKSNQVMEDLSLGDLVGQPYGTHRHYNVVGTPVTVGVGSILSEEGFSFMLSPAAAGSVWKTLRSYGAIPMGTNGWERLRVFQGRPAPGKELTNEFNVLEASLWRAISLNKGCYKGQETVARLITYDGVKQRLWGLRLSGPVQPGSTITLGGRKVGKVTSYSIGRSDCEHVALGYIKKKACSVGDVVNIGDVVGEVIEVPFLSSVTPDQVLNTTK